MIGYLGENENGLPIFSDPEEYVGSYCADVNGFDYITHVGELRFDHNGNLMIGNANGNWVAFDWNNWAHQSWAHQRQRYGDYGTWGCGVGGHWPDFTHAWESAFGEEGTCADVMDHYYGHFYAALEGLTGEFAMYNGHTLMDASFMANLINHLSVPSDPSYIGTPSEPGQYVESWNFQNWLSYYNRAVNLGLAHLLPFNLQDICNAFPEEPCS